MTAAQTPESTPNAGELDRLRQKLERNQLQIEVSSVVVSKLSLKDVLVAVSDLLKKFIDHDVASVVLYNEELKEARVHALAEPPPGGILLEGAVMPLEGTPPGLAIRSRKSVRCTHLDFDEFTSPIMKEAYRAGVRSGCSVPLISHGRVLGAINVGCMREAGVSDEDQELMEQIASPVAIAVENALNFERAERERKRHQLLLEINNAVISHLDLEQLVKTISGTLRDIMPHEAAGIARYEPEFNHLREYTNVGYNEVNAFRVGDTIPLEGTPAGDVFTTGKPMLLKRPDPAKYPHDRYSQPDAEGNPRSACLAPLTVHGRKLGIVGVSSTQDDRFTEKDLELFTQIAGQVAIAVDNALNFERAREAEKEIRRRFERERLMLQINNAVVSKLTLKELIRDVATCLQKVLRPDITGISLYDPETNQFRAHMFDLPNSLPPIEEGTPMPLEGTIGGMAFTSGHAVFMDYPDPTVKRHEFDQRMVDVGIKSGGVVPLIAHNRKLGFLGVGSFREAAFSKDDQELLGHIANQIAIAVENALAYREIETLKNTLASEKLYLEEEIKSEFNFAEIVGQSAALKKILRKVQTVAPTDSAVLLFGETGTGKELIARAIHDLSGRRERTLVKLNCAAIPTGLLESELFGHEKGAFTGAIAQRIGRFELANKGTLLLDEIGEIPLELQPKLLRVLQEHEFERLGSSRTIKTDARLVAATNCDLPQMVAEKKFRSDLFYRLNVFPINVPALRERTDDIPLLAGYFTQKHALRMNRRITTIDKQTVDALTAYPWPGNVRELENFIERAVILTTGSELQAPLAELAVSMNGGSDKEFAAPGAAATAPRPVTLEDAERAHIEEIVKQTRGVIGGKGGAAEILGLPVSTLRNRMKKLGLK